MLTLKATTRNQANTQALRDESRIPGVVYGPSQESITVSVDYQEFRKVIRETELHKTFELDVDGKKVAVFVKDFARDKVQNTYIHVDFYAVDEKRAVIVPVPVSFEGESPAMRVGAMLTVALPKVQVKALPKDIPAKITANIASLKADGDKIRISDLESYENTEYMMDANAMVAKAEMSRASKKAASEEEASAEEETPTEGGEEGGETQE